MALRDWTPRQIGGLWMTAAAVQLAALLTLPPLVARLLGGGRREPESTGAVFAGIMQDLVIQLDTAVAILVLPLLAMTALTVAWALQRRRPAPA